MLKSLPTAPMAAFALNLLMAGPADTATIERHSDAVMGCTIILSGPIVKGDSDRLEEYLSANSDSTRGRMCLNSQGGSFLEGVRLAQIIRTQPYFGVAIAEGHACESACAIAFMAGGWTEGGYDSVKPIMHPKSSLGFHAPSIQIPSGRYSEQQVAQAWNVALQAVAEIVAMRASPLNVSDNYNFNEQLFLKMLLTPSDSMFYIDTVEKATSYEIAVYPVGVNYGQPRDAVKNLCMLASGWSTSGPGIMPEIRRTSVDEIEILFSEGFGEEAVQSCRAVLNIDRLSDRGVFQYSKKRPIPIYLGREETGGYPYMTFDGSARLDSLPVDIESTWRGLTDRVGLTEAPALQSFASCWLSAPNARVTNVNEYVNLRLEPDFSGRVIRQVPLGEQVRPVRFDNLTVIGQERYRQPCIKACEVFGQNIEDRVAHNLVQQCIDENMLWYEITDARGNRGWVSRKFLEAVQ